MASRYRYLPDDLRYNRYRAFGVFAYLQGSSSGQKASNLQVEIYYDIDMSRLCVMLSSFK